MSSSITAERARELANIYRGGARPVHKEAADALEELVALKEQPQGSPALIAKHMDRCSELEGERDGFQRELEEREQLHKRTLEGLTLARKRIGELEANLAGERGLSSGRHKALRKAEERIFTLERELVELRSSRAELERIVREASEGNCIDCAKLNGTCPTCEEAHREMDEYAAGK